MSAPCADDDESGAAVRDGRAGGQPGVGSSIPAVHLHFGKWDHPAHCEHTAAPAQPHILHSPAAGQCVCVFMCAVL